MCICNVDAFLVVAISLLDKTSHQVGCCKNHFCISQLLWRKLLALPPFLSAHIAHEGRPLWHRCGVSGAAQAAAWQGWLPALLCLELGCVRLSRTSLVQLTQSFSLFTVSHYRCFKHWLRGRSLGPNLSSSAENDGSPQSAVGCEARAMLQTAELLCKCYPVAYSVCACALRTTSLPSPSPYLLIKDFTELPTLSGTGLKSPDLAGIFWERRQGWQLLVL